MARNTIEFIQQKKENGQKITMLTAYDYPTADLIDRSGIDIILVGDSLANVVLGLESTTEVGMFEMLHHAKAVNRAVKNSLLVGDMPYESYQKSPEEAVKNAKRFIDEAGCNAVKVEWCDQCLTFTKEIVKAGIPVMGHVGLTPQTAQEFKVQGRDSESAKEILNNAKAFEEIGSFSVVLECIPNELSQRISNELKIPTIGIGAGVDCDGQVLVTHDVLGLFDRFKPKFVKNYISLNEAILKALEQYKLDVEQKIFPDDQHSYK